MDIINYALDITKGAVEPVDLPWLFIVGKFLRYEVPRDGLYWKYYKNSCTYLKRALNKALFTPMSGALSLDAVSILLSYEYNHVSRGLPIVLENNKLEDRIRWFFYSRLKRFGDGEAKLLDYSKDVESRLGVFIGLHADKIEEILKEGNLERILLINPKGNYRKLNINIVQRSKPSIPIPCLPLREEDCCRK